jgi:hypothetical protein
MGFSRRTVDVKAGVMQGSEPATSIELAGCCFSSPMSAEIQVTIRPMAVVKTSGRTIARPDAVSQTFAIRKAKSLLQWNYVWGRR